MDIINKKLVHKSNSLATAVVVGETNKGYKLQVTAPKHWTYGKVATKIAYFPSIDIVGEKANWKMLETS